MNMSEQGESASEMSQPIFKVNPQRAETLVSNLSAIHSRISSVLKSHPELSHTAASPPRLVAVSKLKPASDILALHSHSPPQLHFGENYVQELIEKSRLLPQSVKWHFIGGLQSNKCTQLAREVQNLWAVESVDSIKKAQFLDKGRGEAAEKRKAETQEDAEGAGNEPLRVFVQVNTSGEESKSGVEPKSDELVELCKKIHGNECGNLKLQGLMTIGAIARSQATTAENENEDFICLRDVRTLVAKELGVAEDELELSMGMSEDFEGAIVQGSDEVRIGSTIFGERPPKKEAKVLEEAEDGKK